MNDNPGCLTALLRLFGINLAPKPSDDLPYRLRDDFLSAAERSFFGVLQGVVGNRAVICPKVNLADVFFVVRPHENQAYRNRIDRKHVDFLLCDPKTMLPLAGIELDDASHKRESRQERDEFVNAVFETAGLPLLRFPAAKGYTPAQIAAQIEPVFQKRPPRVPATKVPTCPKCGEPMLLRTAKQGQNQGSQFYGCPNYPRCRETVPVQG